MDAADWDHRSHQPYPLQRERKRALRRGCTPAALRAYAAGMARLANLPASCRPDTWQPTGGRRDFCGLALGLDEADAATYAPVIEELGCRHLLLRIPAWADDLEPYLDLLRRLPQHDWLIALMQDRACVEDPERWRTALERIIAACRPYTHWFQIGQAPNRIKWGCADVGEYHQLWAVAEELRRDDPQLRLAGPALLDFEPLALATACALPAGSHIDACTLGLYVDRRGGPGERQGLLFDLRRKLQLSAAIARASGRCAPRLWISETNWPLSGNGDYAPASETYRVDEATYARHMLDYLGIAQRSGVVERVYWWQPIAKGYGLIDGLTGRKRPAFFALKRWLAH